MEMENKTLIMDDENIVDANANIDVDVDVETNNHVSEPELNVNIKEEFQYHFKEEGEMEDEFEKTLEKEIEKNCDFNIYVDKLEVDDKTTDEELQKQEKHEIINFKNYQIQKFKAYIYSLEKEKEDLIENFKTTTNVLLEKIKELEFNQTGVRPVTPFIANKLNKKYNAYLEERGANNNINNNMNKNVDKDKLNKMFYGDEENKNTYTNNNLNTATDLLANEEKKSTGPNEKKRCVNCQREYLQENFLQHTLECIRNKIRCKKCNELIEEKNKKDHLLEWRSPEVLNIK
jgi:hypothetical protein